MIHEQHPHRRIELEICIVYCSAGRDASNHKAGIGNGNHDVELCDDRRAKVGDIRPRRCKREIEKKKYITHVSNLAGYIVSSWFGWYAESILDKKISI